jgi:hypothetical protein
MLSRRAAVERTATAVERHASARESIRQYIVCKRDNLVPARMNVAVHVANEMPDSRRLGKIARMNDENVLVRSANHIRGLRVVMQQLTGVQDGAGWQLEREHDAVRRFDESPHATAIDGAHGQFDDRQAGRRFGMRMKQANRNWRR